MNLARETKVQKLNHPVEVMRFTLVYDGPLPSAANNSRLPEKQHIRREFHKQLNDLWQTNPALKRFFEPWAKSTPDQQREVLGKKGSFVQCFERGQFRFIPLVTGVHSLLCELDILFLRAEGPGKLFQTNSKGDLDNRLLVLFDALRIPKETNELPADALPTSSEDPFFCLLENDSMISAVRLESERLYGNGTSDLRDHVRLIVRVKILLTEVTDGMTLAVVLAD